MTEVYEYRRSRRVIWTGFFYLAFTSLVFMLDQASPRESTWLSTAGQEMFDKIQGEMKTGGIVLASLAFLFAGEFSISNILAKTKVLTQGWWLWSRIIGCTPVGKGFDSLTFIRVVSVFGGFSWEQFFTLVVTDYIFKVGVEAMMPSITYLIVHF